MSTTAKKNTGAKAPAAKKKAAAAEAPAKAKPGRKKGLGVTPEQAKAAHARLAAGETTLIAESKKLGFTHNGPLRAALRELIGPDKYAALMAGNPKATPAKKAAAKPAAKKAPAKKAPAKKAAQKDEPAAAPAADDAAQPAEG